MTQRFANVARGVLASAIAPGTTTIELTQGGDLFPVISGNEWFKAVLQDADGIEIIRVNARTGNVFTVVRGQEGTTARAFSVGTVVGLRITAADVEGSIATANNSVQLTGDQNIGGIKTFSSQIVASGGVQGNVTGSAANVTGTVAVSNGGTGATTAAAARTNLGATTLGENLFTLANVVAISFPRINADNSVSSLDAATFRTAIGAGTSSTTGTVTSIVAGTGLSGGTITNSGTIALVNTGVSAGSYTNTNITVDAQGRITAASNGPGGVSSINGTASGLTLNDGYTEEIFAVTGTTPALSPTNGSIQTWTLSGASTPTQGTWANGQSITLLIDDGTANTINWSSLGVVWKTNGGSAPTLLTTGLTVIQLWEVGNVIYGARVGDA